MICLICKKETTGSIGAAGIKWARLCQPCKDEEDRIVAEKVKTLKFINEKIKGDYE